MREPLATSLAFERFLTGVKTLVFCQVMFVLEGFITEGTGERSLAFGRNL